MLLKTFRQRHSVLELLKNGRFLPSIRSKHFSCQPSRSNSSRKAYSAGYVLPRTVRESRYTFYGIYPRGGGNIPLFGLVRGCTAAQGMVFDLSVLNIRVLSRIYRLGEKSRVAEGYELPSGVRGHVPPRKIFQMNMC